MKTESYLLRLDEKDKKAIQANAKKAGLSMAAYLRILGLKGINISWEANTNGKNSARRTVRG